MPQLKRGSIQVSTDCISPEYIRRFKSGEWRAQIFRDLILEDLRGRTKPVCLDIGCGHGFDGDHRIQRQLADASEQYIGIEPDTSITVPEYFNETYHCVFEEAPVPHGSIDVAFAVMVLEHLKEPLPFWDKLSAVLVDGGVFWGFTMDRSHPFCTASRIAEYCGIKERLLHMLHGKRGEERYENYPTFYRANSKKDLASAAGRFAKTSIVNLGRIGQMDYYLPKVMRPIGHLFDRVLLGMGGPGTLLAVRFEK